MNVALYIDGLYGFGGGQRYALYLAEVFKPHIFTGFYKNAFPGFGSYKLTVLGRRFFPSFLSAIFSINKFKKLPDFKHDLYVFVGNLALAAKKKEYRPSVWVSFGPMRRLYLEKPGFLTGIGNFFLRRSFKRVEYVISEFDLVIAISETVKERLLRVYGSRIRSEIIVIYPPVKVEKYAWNSPGGYYLYVGRLDRKKRVDLIVRAFAELGEKKLKIVGDGVLRNFVKKYAVRHKNIEYLGTLPEERLIQLYSKAIATIYIPYEEDFGLVPVESQAAGKPCIGINSGGVKESIIHGETGYLIEEPANSEKLKKAILWMSEKRAEDMKDKCIENARRFSFQNFSQRLKHTIAEIAHR